MSDVNLTAAIRANLLSLDRTTRLADRTSNRLSTGLKVNSPVDDAVAFFSARALNDRASDIDLRKSQIDQAVSSVNVALQATDTIDSILKQLKGLIESARSLFSNATNLVPLTRQFLDLLGQINNVVRDATYQGQTLIGQSSTGGTTNQATAALTVNFSDLSQSRLQIFGRFLGVGVVENGFSLGQNRGAALSTAGIGLFATSTVGNSAFNGLLSVDGRFVVSTGVIGLLARQRSTAAAAAAGGNLGDNRRFLSVALNNNASVGLSQLSLRGLDAITFSLDEAIAKVRSTAATLGSNAALLSVRLDFTREYVNELEGGAGKFTLADLNEEGANLVALQTRQQLGIQSLSFSGQITQSILRLFQ